MHPRLKKYRVTAMVQRDKRIRKETRTEIEVTDQFARLEAVWSWADQVAIVTEVLSVKEVQKRDFFALGALFLSMAFVAVAATV